MSFYSLIYNLTLAARICLIIVIDANKETVTENKVNPVARD